MGIVMNKQVVDNIAINGKVVDGIAYDGSIIFQKSKFKIVTFKDGTDEEIAAMLDAHYAGEIDISDYWSIGDERVIQLTNLGSSGTVNYDGQKMTMVIIGFNHDDLKTKQGIRTKAAITLQCREVLGSEEYYRGRKYIPVPNYANYIGYSIRSYLNGTFINAMPSTFTSLIKTVIKKNLSLHSESSGSPVNSEDKAFYLSYPEVFGTVTYQYYLKGTDPGDYEGLQYDYYKVTSNRIKYNNIDGFKGGTKKDWWLRSPSSYLRAVNDYDWVEVRVGKPGALNGQETSCLAPAFCL